MFLASVEIFVPSRYVQFQLQSSARDTLASQTDLVVDIPDLQGRMQYRSGSS